MSGFTFPSRARPAPHSASSITSTSSQQTGPFPPPPQHARPLPAFGNPNHFPNPPSHYFPSAKGGTAQGRRRPGAEDEDARIPSSPSPPPVPQQVAVEKKSALPKKGSGVGAARREEWNAASALLEELDEESDELEDGMQIDGDGDEEMEDEEGAVDLSAPGARARQKELQEKVGAKGEPAKKRSRTLTTPQQTRVLNALLAKTRFPSTETRQQVGQEIGMSARRVQIWFQNRRQSQKRARDREATDGPGGGAYNDDDRSSMHSAHSSHSHHSHHYAAHPFPLTQRTTHGSFPSHAHAAAVYGGAHSYASPYPIPTHAQTHSYPLSTHASPYLRTDPYARYPPPGEPASRSQIHSEGRRRVHRQGSMDSVASASSFASAHTRGSTIAQRETDTLSPLPTERGRGWPVGGGAAWPGSPPPTDHFSSAPQSPVAGATGVQLPSLFSVLNGSNGGPNVGQDREQTEQRDPHRSGAFSPAPSIGADEFSRLDIREEQHLAQTADLLDMTIDAVSRARAAPPKSSLPPLRMALGPSHFAEEMDAPPAQRGEADKALLAPIVPRAAAADEKESGRGVRLPSLASIGAFPPISSTFPSMPHSSSSATTVRALTTQADEPTSSSPTLTTPQSPFAHRDSTWSTVSQAPTNYSFPQVRSSVSSFDTGTSFVRGEPLATSVNGFGAGKPKEEGASPPNAVKEEGRGSFSSDVQEEWERYTKNGGKGEPNGAQLLGMQGRQVKI